MIHLKAEHPLEIGSERIAVSPFSVWGIMGSSPQNRPQERPLKVLEIGSESAADRRKHHKSIRRSLLHGARVPPQWLDTVATLSTGGAADSRSGALHTSSSPRDAGLFLQLTSRIYGNDAETTASCMYGTLWSLTNYTRDTRDWWRLKQLSPYLVFLSHHS